MDNQRKVRYAVFMDGVQTVLLFSYNEELIKRASGVRKIRLIRFFPTIVVFKLDIFIGRFTWSTYANSTQ